MKRINALLAALTAFDTLEEFAAAAATGYVPTIFPRSARHGELIRSLRASGYKVWTGK